MATTKNLSNTVKMSLKKWIFYFLLGGAAVPSLGTALFSNLLWIRRIKNPNNTAPRIKALFTIPSVGNEILIKIVEITNPEFLIILWNLSE